MTNDATRASAQALPKINRRKALALVGLGAASAAALPSQGMTATPSDLATIEGLIATHAEAYTKNGKLWEAAGDLGPIDIQDSQIV